MAVIKKLTDAQVAKFPDYVRDWTERGLCCKPADRPRAEAAIAEMYRCGGIEPPKRIIWCGSPLGNALAKAVLRPPSVWDSVRASVWDSVRDSVWDSVRDSVRDSVWDSVAASVRDSVGASVGASVYGSHDAPWLSFYSFFHNECGLVKQTEKLAGLFALCASANWAIPCKDICFVSERHHRLLRDSRGSLHCADGPAVSYPDGFSIWAWHGVRVSQDIIEKPDTITMERILKEENSEVRRVMIERRGFEWFFAQAQSKLLDSAVQRVLPPHDNGQTWVNELHEIKSVNDGEPIVLLRLVCPSTLRQYVERVHPECRTVREAIGWQLRVPREQWGSYQIASES